jgi:hypothetical protein
MLTFTSAFQLHVGGLFNVQSAVLFRHTSIITLVLYRAQHIPELQVVAGVESCVTDTDIDMRRTV